MLGVAHREPPHSFKEKEMEYTGLFPKEVRETIPARIVEDDIDNVLVPVKFFCPWNNWKWYVIEGEPMLDDDGEEYDFKFYGFVVGDFSEFGYFTREQLESVSGMFGMKIERDMLWSPTPLKDCPGYTS